MKWNFYERKKLELANANLPCEVYEKKIKELISEIENHQDTKEDQPDLNADRFLLIGEVVLNPKKSGVYNRF